MSHAYVKTANAWSLV